MSELETELAQDLEKAKNELKRVKEEYRDYAYIVSHDFSAPFRQIEGFSKLLSSRLHDQLDDKSKQHFEFIVKAAAGCQRMLEALLTFSRLESSPFAIEEVALDDVIMRVKERLSLPMEEREVILSHDALPVVYMKPAHADQLFYELIKNAIDYTPAEKAPKITISCETCDGIANIEIRDNGAGIESDQIAGLFTIFRRGDVPEYSHGNGMGLAYVKKILSFHGSDIALTSEKGEGTTATFVLPTHV